MVSSCAWRRSARRSTPSSDAGVTTSFGAGGAARPHAAPIAASTTARTDTRRTPRILSPAKVYNRPKVSRRLTIIGTWTFAVALHACGSSPAPRPPTLDEAAERYVRIVLALGERDADSLDSYYGPA